jgi:hypothetical protein
MLKNQSEGAMYSEGLEADQALLFGTSLHDKQVHQQCKWLLKGSELHPRNLIFL